MRKLMIVERIRYYGTMLRDVFLVPIVLLMPRNRKKIIFGAWSGHQYSCNPKHLFEYMVKRGGFDCYWIGDAKLREVVLATPGARFLVKGSVRAFWHCLTARFYVCNVQWKSDVIRIPTCGRVVHLYLTHGMPDKKMGEYQFNGHGRAPNEKLRCDGRLRRLIRQLIVMIDGWMFDQRSWCSCSSAQSRDIYIANLPERISLSRSFCSGTPRGDFMIHSAQDCYLKRKIKRKYAKILNLPLDKKWYVFVPTWRHDKEYLFSFASSAHLDEYQKLLSDQDAILIEKQHPQTLENLGVKGGKIEKLLVVSTEQARQIELQELLVACDRLITDYSSVYYDFVLMNRPVIHYAYDYDHFMNVDMGFCFDIREYGGGPFAYDEENLLKFMRLDDADLLQLRNKKTQVQLTFENGHSCDTYYDLITKLSKRNTDAIYARVNG